MNPGHPQIATCPSCGAEKELLSLMSGNTFGARYWSDNKREAPMLPQVSYVQKCPQCGKYYILSRQKTRQAKDGCSFELGTLNFIEMRDAFEQLKAEGFKDHAEECQVRILLLQTYNDCFYRSRNENEITPNSGDLELMTSNLLWLIDNWSEDALLKAELYREAGYMKEAIDLLNKTSVSEDFQLKIKGEILRRAKDNDSSVFELTNI